MTDTTDTPPNEPNAPVAVDDLTVAIDQIVAALMEAVHPRLEERIRAAVTIFTHIAGNNFMATALSVNKAMLEQVRQQVDLLQRDQRIVIIRLDTLDAQQQLLVEALRDGELHRLFAEDAPSPSPEAREAGV